MKIIKADPWYRTMTKEEINEFLNKPFILRLGIIDSDGYPIVHPVWFIYKNENIFILSHKNSKKVRLLSYNKKVYFTIDVDKPIGVRGKGDAELIEGDKIELMKEMLTKYNIELNSNLAKSLLEEAIDSVIIKIKPRFIATWIYE